MPRPLIHQLMAFSLLYALTPGERRAQAPTHQEESSFEEERSRKQAEAKQLLDDRAAAPYREARRLRNLAKMKT